MIVQPGSVRRHLNIVENEYDVETAMSVPATPVPQVSRVWQESEENKKNERAVKNRSMFFSVWFFVPLYF